MATFITYCLREIHKNKGTNQTIAPVVKQGISGERGKNDCLLDEHGLCVGECSHAESREHWPKKRLAKRAQPSLE